MKIWKVAIFFLVIFIKNAFADDNDDLVGTTNVSAVVGRTTAIPCNIQPENPDDRVYMVLWFRDAGGRPIYSFDVRGRSLGEALHWSDPSAFGARASFNISTAPASLTVMAVEQDDEGSYRCRVDFKNSPTRNFILNLVSVVPPHQVIMYNAKVLDLAGVVGPLVEQQNFTIFCEVRGGKPEPTISWSMDNTEALDHEVVRRGHMVIVSKLQIVGARRDWLDRKIVCQASNTDLIPPLTRSARIEMHLPPTIVQIALKPEIMYAGEKYYLTCISVGSRPAANLVWYNDGKQYGNQEHQHSFTNDTCTVATVLFIPGPADHNKTMECVSTNTVLGISTSDKFHLKVFFKPVMTIMSGNTYDLEEIRVNDDIYLECDGHGNPPIKNYSWYFNGELVGENKENNLYKNLNRLIIRHVTKEQRGIWTCQASNRLGPSKQSDPLFLRVRYKPECAQEKTYYAAKLYDKVYLRCTVHGDPDIIDFNWIFRSKIKRPITKFISGSRTTTFFNGKGTTNELPLLVSSEMDYGTLSCYANNSIGRMEKPCVIEVVKPRVTRSITGSNHGKDNRRLFPLESATFALLPQPSAMFAFRRGGRTRVGSALDDQGHGTVPTKPYPTPPKTAPEPPLVCHEHEKYWNYIRVTCISGYNGGLPQYFSVDAINYMSNPIRNRTLKIYGNPTTLGKGPLPYRPYPKQKKLYESFVNFTINITPEVLQDLTENEAVGISAHNANGSSYPTLLSYDFYSYKVKYAKNEEDPQHLSITVKLYIVLGMFIVVLLIVAGSFLFLKHHPQYYNTEGRRGRRNVTNSRPDRSLATQPVPHEWPRTAYRPPTPPPSPMSKNVRHGRVSRPMMQDFELREVLAEQFLDGSYRVHRPINTVPEVDEEVDENNPGPFLGSDDYPDSERAMALQPRLKLVIMGRRYDPRMFRETHI